MEIFKRNKLLIILAGLFLGGSIIINFSTSSIVEYFASGWKQKSSEQIAQIESECSELIITHQNKLIEILNQLSTDFVDLINSNGYSERKLFNLINNERFEDIHFQIFENDSQLIAWSSEFGNIVDSHLSVTYSEEECFFFNSDLFVFLTAFTDTSGYKIFASMPVEKEYTLSNLYYNPISLSRELTSRFGTTTRISYSTLKEPLKDGRKYSFPLHNNFNNIIAHVTIDKPAISAYKNSIRETLVFIESYLLIASILLLGVVLQRNKKLFKYRSVKFIVLAIYTLTLRVLLFLLNIPSKYFSSGISNPDYFDSSFAFGTVNSPLEFLITTVLLLFVLIIGVRYLLQYLNDVHKQDLKPLYSISVSLFLVTVFILSLRGFGATIRSVIFESSLRYFKYPALLPDTPTIVMDFNLLVMGLCTVLFLIVLSVALMLLVEKTAKTNNLYFIIGIFIVLQLSALLFDQLQNQPQGTPLLRVSAIFIVFVFGYFLYKNRKVTAIYIIAVLFSSSLITISYLTYYNADYEIKSLRTTAYELIKTDEDFINDLIKITLEDESIDSDLENILSESSNKNYDAIAFKVWSNSKLENETISSLVNIIDGSKVLLGSYGYQFYEDFIWDWSIEDSLRSISMAETPIENSDNKILRGIKPIVKKERILGYLEISVLHDLYSLGFEDNPPFISTSKALKESPVNVQQLKVFDFQDGELINYYTDLIPSRPETETILNTELNEFNEAWITIPLNDVDHIVYVKKVSDNNKNRVLATALAEKNLTWNLFDFFKIFFIHTIFILVGLVLSYLVYFRKYFRLRYSFRTQLLIAFILISTLPLILLAVYFKNLTNEKNTSAIYYKLGKRADRVEQYLNDYTDEDSILPDFLLVRTNLDLGINYDLFKDKELVYSSKQVYYDIGLMQSVLNSEVYSNLVLTGLTEFVVDESIENYNYHSFYHKATLAGENYLIKVSDVFNQIQLPMSSTEVDIFLFGSYSLAIILIIVFSTFLANQISSPIRRLTNATKLVAEGDLSVIVEEKNHGEIQELVDGFNEMVKELDKNQKQLAEVEREAAWRDMAKQVAHEIKNPLTPMKLAVQQLIAAKADKSYKFEQIFDKVTGTVIKQIDILKNIATEFSNYAKMPDLKLKDINLVESIKNVSNLFTENNIEIHHKFDGTSYQITADSEQLERTLINLMKNSVQAGANRIEFELKQIDGKLLLKVSDNGKGIPASIVDRIFDADFTTKIEGMGLGLHMAKKFLDLINSTIEIAESTSNGTTILITFPVVSI